MYSAMSKAERVKVKSTLTGGWTLSGAAGISSILISPNTIVAEIGMTVVLIWGWGLSVSALLAASGVFWNRYRWEWYAAWFAAAASVPYIGALWGLVVTGTATRLTQAFLATSLMLFFLHRAYMCEAHAAKLRELHKLSTEEVPTS